MSLIIITILLAFAFDFINGFHDAANSIATIVATGALSPTKAVVWAAFFNFIAFLFFNLSVATTISEGLVLPTIITTFLIFCALLAAIIWNLFTWYFGIPSSSSHALIGGLIGAAFMKGGIDVLIFPGICKILLAIIISPAVGMLLAISLNALFQLIRKQWRQSTQVTFFNWAQYISAAALSLSHGANDAQKTMGIIAILLFSSNLISGSFHIPFWVVVSCNFVMGLGTLAGGWRIVNTIGKKITQLTPMTGASVQSSAAFTILLATVLGIPISTTHTITGAVTGISIINKTKPIRWELIKQIVSAWIFTIPATGGLAAMFISIF